LTIAAALALAVAAFTSCAPANKPATESQPASTESALSPLDRGKQLTVVGGCIDCHTPGTLFGAPDFSRNLSGSELGWQGPWGTTYARNLTPDPETGLGRYKAEEIVAAIKGGKRLDGSPMLPPMPWQNYAGMSDEDLNAIAAYLLSLPPVKHAVPDRVAPGMKPAGSFLTFPAPSEWDVPKTPAAGAGGGGH
jgi:mono/diheme cytochrome c family protein